MQRAPPNRPVGRLCKRHTQIQSESSTNANTTLQYTHRRDPCPFRYCHSGRAYTSNSLEQLLHPLQSKEQKGELLQLLQLHNAPASNASDCSNGSTTTLGTDGFVRRTAVIPAFSGLVIDAANALVADPRTSYNNAVAVHTHRSV
jgi:hypothetical protein